MAHNAEKINSTILVAPLDWGLGHATRCIPIIRLLLQKKCRVIVAASGYHLTLLQQEFPNITCIHLDGYGITYGKRNLILSLLGQLPQLMRAIGQEKKWLEKVIDQYQITGIISDNRYGLSHPTVPCVFITHQLQVKAPRYWGWMEAVCRNALYTYINQFSECWVPDAATPLQRLAGTLSTPIRMPQIPVHYIGWLTRFTHLPPPNKKFTATICLSGPEPQRSLLEQLLLPQLSTLSGTFLLIRGMPGSQEQMELPTHITVVNHLPTNDMQQAFLQSHYVISRSGYSTIMDMQALQCQCIYIPTPGQTEQEYVGECLSYKKIALVKKQAGFNLQEALQEAATFAYHRADYDHNSLLQPVAAAWLQSLPSNPSIVAA